MKKIAFLVLLSIMSVGLAFSQNRSQVLADIRFTMEDFMADLNFINEDRLYFNRRLDNLAASFGSPEYFIRNGKKTVSFRNWFKNYCTHDIQGLEIEHSIDILEKTFRKVDEKKNSDKRYSFDVILKRQYFLNGRSYDFPEEKLNMTIVWQGENQYVLLVGLEGNMKQITANAINGTQKQEKQFYNSNGTVKKKQITYVTSDNKNKADIVSREIADFEARKANIQATCNVPQTIVELGARPAHWENGTLKVTLIVKNKAMNPSALSVERSSGRYRTIDGKSGNGKARYVGGDYIGGRYVLKKGDMAFVTIEIKNMPSSGELERVSANLSCQYGKGTVTVSNVVWDVKYQK